MTTKTQAVLQEALALDASERAELIDALFRSFGLPAAPEVDAKWAGEAESRIDASEAGQIPANPAEEMSGRPWKVAPA